METNLVGLMVAYTEIMKYVEKFDKKVKLSFHCHQLTELAFGEFYQKVEESIGISDKIINLEIKFPERLITLLHKRPHPDLNNRNMLGIRMRDEIMRMERLAFRMEEIEDLIEIPGIEPREAPV